ncbi:DUF4132 domain-containing protein [Plantactinospora sp. KLBMP9567]|uniref:DUF4132 domain-containing protein n=1 Tax=Plantactinospora sp. KLBMP9567 TaxID=3085900 RepID=UPI002980D0CB|nr:DUF4132 domain-containing protein [Plantactinospora sp. KLBMP9567]MDW5325014.1 DUF4132 domain-containing protein [Plantactinospora sp. KLBMP9567]
MAELARRGDVQGLADEALAYAAVYTGHWGHESRHVTDALGLVAPERKPELLMAILDRCCRVTETDHRRVTNELLEILVRRYSKITTPDSAAVALGFAARHTAYFDGEEQRRMAALLLDAGRPLPPEVVAMMRRTVAHGYWGSAEALKPLLDKLDAPALSPGEAWADRALADVASLDPDEARRWHELFRHAVTATSAKPSQKWETAARRLLDELPEPGDRLRSWLALVGQPRTIRLNRTRWEHDVNEAFDQFNTTPLRGLVWMTSFLPDHPETPRTLGTLVEAALRKVAGLGPRSPKIANAAVYALSRVPTEAALAQIARLAARVTFKGTLKELNAALDARAAALGLTRDEVEELAVPAYGLTEVGRRVEHFGDASATLDATSGTVTVTWRNSTGKIVKSVPASVRSAYPEQLTDFKAAVKDVEKMLSAQAERLDRQFLAQRVWPFDAWRARYLDHPLLGTLARRLIWLVDDVPCAFADGALRTHEDKEIAAGETVRLWHPIGREVAEVLAWRAWLEANRVTQPFKQAHREVYLLTAAEENTRVYSNRYAAHVLRQHQFHALTAARGWRNKLRMMVDDAYEPATRELPQWGLRAEFWIEGIGDDWEADTTESGAYLRIATDQVRFYPIGAPEHYAHAGGGGYEQWVSQDAQPTDPVPLAEIPPLVLSEVLRDVDLFVGVASVGNDPTWQDGGPGGRFREYWASYSFGELSGTAQTRREMLERLVPRLAIADRAKVEGRFLVVRGDLRTYKIHLGSGNILMSPNDQYLCIVPKQTASSSTGDVFLPFEGDRVLAVILSKALMLAKDIQITDRTITQQLRG